MFYYVFQCSIAPQDAQQFRFTMFCSVLLRFAVFHQTYGKRCVHMQFMLDLLTYSQSFLFLIENEGWIKWQVRHCILQPAGVEPGQSLDS